MRWWPLVVGEEERLGSEFFRGGAFGGGFSAGFRGCFCGWFCGWFRGWFGGCFRGWFGGLDFAFGECDGAGALDDVIALVAGAVGFWAIPEGVHDEFEVLVDFVEDPFCFVDEVVAVWAVPAEGVFLRLALFVEASREFGDEADGVGGSLWAVGDPAWEEEEFALFDDDVVWFGAVEWADADGDGALELVEEFFGGVDVVVVAGVWAA